MTGSLGIQRDAMNMPVTIKNFAPQHPSWKVEAKSVLKEQITSIMMWKIARDQLVRTRALAPAHAFPPPEASGQSKPKVSVQPKSQLNRYMQQIVRISQLTLNTT